MGSRSRLEHFYENGDNAVGGNEAQAFGRDDGQRQLIETSRRRQWPRGGRSTLGRTFQRTATKEIFPRPDVYQSLHDQTTPIVNNVLRQRVTIRVRFAVVHSPRSVYLYAKQMVNMTSSSENTTIERLPSQIMQRVMVVQP